MKKALVIGSMNYDIFLNLSQIPQIGETAAAQDCKFGTGGKGANQAVQMAKLGVETYMAGCIGKDQMGEALRISMEKAGVNCSLVRTLDHTATGMGIVDVFEDGSVMAVISPGANAGPQAADVDAALGRAEEAGLLVLQLEIPLETVGYAIGKAGQKGIPVLLNAAPAAALEESLLQKCRYVIVNEVEASFYAGHPVTTVEEAMECLPKLAEKYGNFWICTLGRYGSVACGAERIRHIPAVSRTAVETTGAGDSYVGGFAYGLLNRMDEFEAAEFAAYCSAFTIRSTGAQASMPTIEDLKKEYPVQMCILH